MCDTTSYFAATMITPAIISDICPVKRNGEEQLYSITLPVINDSPASNDPGSIWLPYLKLDNASAYDASLLKVRIDPENNKLKVTSTAVDGETS